MLAAHTVLPVIGVPLSSTSRGVPVATVAIDGVSNAAILAAQILAVAHPDLREQLAEFKAGLAEGLRF